MKPIVLTMALIAIPVSLAAQELGKSFKYRGSGYVFSSLGACLHGYANAGIGGGGEAFLWRGLSIGAEIAYQDFPSDSGPGFGVATLNPGYHFVNRKKAAKVDPYVHMTLLGVGFRPYDLAPAGHLGGGVNYWFKERIGLRVGARFQAVAAEPIIAFQIGLAFR